MSSMNEKALTDFFITFLTLNTKLQIFDAVSNMFQKAHIYLQFDFIASIDRVSR